MSSGVDASPKRQGHALEGSPARTDYIQKKKGALIRPCLLDDLDQLQEVVHSREPNARRSAKVLRAAKLPSALKPLGGMKHTPQGSTF